MTNHPWGHPKPYNDFSSYFRKKFANRVQKISIDAGFTCPNRDGSRGHGGCTYCNNDTFNPFYCSPQKSVKQQLTEGIAFFAEKYKTQQYLAYFQAYSNTYAPLEQLKKLYSEALETEGVIGLVIATRPDCVDEAKLDYLQELAQSHYITLEYGIETCDDDSLRRINRGHTHAETVKALELSANRGLEIGVHLILGLPGESNELILSHADTLNALPFDFLKLHQLQIVTGTILEKQYKKIPENFRLYTADEYIDLCVRFAERLRPDIIIERWTSESPPEFLIAPKWGGMKNFEFTAKVEKHFAELQTYQGKLYKSELY